MWRTRVGHWMNSRAWLDRTGDDGSCSKSTHPCHRQGRILQAPSQALQESNVSTVTSNTCHLLSHLKIPPQAMNTKLTVLINTANSQRKTAPNWFLVGLPGLVPLKTAALSFNSHIESQWQTSTDPSCAIPRGMGPSQPWDATAGTMLGCSAFPSSLHKATRSLPKPKMTGDISWE